MSYNYEFPHVSALDSDLHELICRFQQLKDEFAKMQEEFTILQSNFDTLQSNFDTLQSNFATLQSNFDKLQSNFDALQDRFNAMETEFNSIKTEFATMNSKIDAIQNDLATMNSKIDAIQNDLDTLKIETSDLQNDLNTLTNRMNIAETNISKITNFLENRTILLWTNPNTVKGREHTETDYYSTNVSKITINDMNRYKFLIVVFQECEPASTNGIIYHTRIIPVQESTSQTIDDAIFALPFSRRSGGQIPANTMYGREFIYNPSEKSLRFQAPYQVALTTGVLTRETNYTIFAPAHVYGLYEIFTSVTT